MPDRDWMTLAKCRAHPNPDIFFPSAKGAGANKQIAEAVRICASCPVIAQCAQYSRDTQSAFGVWAAAIIQTQNYGPTGRTRLMHGTESMYKRHLRRYQKTKDARDLPCHSCRVASQRARALRWQEMGT